MNRPRPRHHLPHRQAGVVLLESLLAIVVFSIGVLTMVSFQSLAIKNSIQAKYRTDASYLANQIVGEMWVKDPATLSSYAGTYNTAGTDWGNRIVGTLPAGSGTVAVNNDTVTVTISWKAPGETATHNFTQTARINH